MIAVARFNDDAALVEELEGFRALIPKGPVEDEAWRLIDRMLTAKSERDCGYSEETLEKLSFAFDLSAMCHAAMADGMRLPENVQAHYGKKARGGSLGGRKDVGGAFALATRQMHSKDAAGEWALQAIIVGERFGLEFPGLGRSKGR
ncbi:MAG: hypothetical protein BroJett013_22870 [Alphaproteobacteria bacterium]|nr:MAG: hypothetical protein BroJett013_22870 [Alphaproteobacteria bacterium]